jgi:hypothetical protein
VYINNRAVPFMTAHMQPQMLRQRERAKSITVGVDESSRNVFLVFWWFLSELSAIANSAIPFCPPVVLCRCTVRTMKDLRVRLLQSFVATPLH